jgi:hypothetical protein
VGSLERVDRERHREESVVTTPACLPPCSNASGIIVSASTVRIAPAAKQRCPPRAERVEAASAAALEAFDGFT